MSDKNLIFSEFQNQYRLGEITPYVLEEEGESFMKSSFGPRGWRITLKVMDFVFWILFIVDIYIFWKYPWYFGILGVFVIGGFVRAVRKSASQALLKLVVEDEFWYFLAKSKGVIRLK